MMEEAFIRYWTPQTDLLEDLPAGTLSVGIAYRPESGKRFGVIQARSRDGRVRLFELWLEADAAEQLVAAIEAMRPWYGLGSSTPPAQAGGAW